MVPFNPKLDLAPSSITKGATFNLSTRKLLYIITCRLQQQFVRNSYILSRGRKGAYARTHLRLQGLLDGIVALANGRVEVGTEREVLDGHERDAELHGYAAP